ncbi:MAG: dethiobiotin synthase [Chromatiaceae bacterium]|nr:dethiobiotin synthase [Chromatiaceae bacterium]
MSRGIFVTGTDTGCGKTHVAQALIRALRARGLRVAGFKPVAAGADWCDGELRNDDALALKREAGHAAAYATINPYCLEAAVAPHLAAAEAGVAIELGVILAAYAQLAARSDVVVVEGAGGWLVPLGPGLDMQGVALALGLPVLLVVGLRLGCLNHALLSERAILAGGGRLLGWIGSQVDPGMARLNGNVATLTERLGAPCLGVIAHPASRERLDPPRPLTLEGL